MKSATLTLLLSALLAITGCIPRYNTYYSHDTTHPQIPGAIKVECRDEKSVLEKVKATLKLVRVLEWVTTDGNYFKEIEARYESLTDEQAAEIEQQLNESYGVMHVEIKRDVVPARNNAGTWRR